jgi:GNAT superfamily N-acetyltransferase
MTTTQAVQVRTLTNDDHPDVVRLLGETMAGGPTGERTADFFTWKHYRNPFGPSLGLLATVDGRLAGVRLFMRWAFEAGGRRIDAVRAVDTATHPDFQGKGIFRTLTLGLLGEIDAAGAADLVFNTPNGNSRPGYLKMGWSEVGTVPVLVRPLRPGRFVRGMAGARAASASGKGHTDDPIEHSPLPVCRLPRAISAFEDEAALTALLSDLPSLPTLHTPVDTRFLRWRYAEAVGLDYRCAVVHDERGVAGVAFGRLRRRGGLAEFTLADVITRPDDRHAARALVRMVRRSSGADHICSVLRPGAARAAGARTGFLRTPGLGIALVANPRRATAVDVMDLRNWSPTLGDLEVF